MKRNNLNQGYVNKSGKLENIKYELSHRNQLNEIK